MKRSWIGSAKTVFDERKKKVTLMKIIRGILFVLIWIGQIAAEAWAGYHVWQLNMVPLRLLMLALVVLSLLWILEGLLFFYGNRLPKGRRKGLVCRLIPCILIVLTVLISIYGVFAAQKVGETVESVTETKAHTTTYGVYVRKEDRAESLDDAADYTFGVTSSYDPQNTAVAIRQLRNHFDTKIKTVDHDSVQEMVDELFDENVDAILINQAYVTILKELEDYKDFSDNTRLIQEIVVEQQSAPVSSKTTNQSDEGLPATNLTPVNDITKDPFVVYLSGSDTRSKTLETSNSDVNILVVINPETKQILLLNTPRDYYIPNPAGGGKLDKLTHCGIYGINTSIEALSNLYDVTVNYYAQINFTGFETLIDAVGGVTIESDQEYTTHNGHYQIHKGTNKLDGAEALGFVRERYAFTTGDNQRGENQMLVLSQVIDKLTSARLITNYNAILNSLQGMFITNVSSEEIQSLVKMQLRDGGDWNIKSFAVTGNTGNDITFSIPRTPVSVMYQDEALVRRGAELVDRVIAGEILEDEDVARETA